MGLYDNFPYTNKHELNTDWIVKKIGDIDRAEEASEASAAAAKASETAAKASETAAAQSAQSAAGSASDAQTSAEYIEDHADRIDFLQTEIDQIVAPTGEAPNPAEIENARIAVNGNVFTTLGNAIRGQVGDLQNAGGAFGIYQNENLIPVNKINIVNRGVTFEHVTNNIFYVHGENTGTAAARAEVYNDPLNLPEGFYPGRKYHVVKYRGTNVTFRIYWVNSSGTEFTSNTLLNGDIFTVPSAAVGARITLSVSVGLTADDVIGIAVHDNGGSNKIYGNLSTYIDEETRTVTEIDPETGQQVQKQVTSRWISTLSKPGIYRITNSDDFYDNPAGTDNMTALLISIPIEERWYNYYITENGLWFDIKSTQGIWTSWAKVSGGGDDDTSRNLPEYYGTYMPEKIAEINSLEDGLPSRSDSLIFLTDYHINRNAQHSQAMIQSIINGTGITKFVFGGDSYATNVDSKATNQKYVTSIYTAFQKCAPDFFCLIGNHEWNKLTSAATENVTEPYENTLSGVYNFCLKRVEQKVSEMSEEGNYYIDIESKKIRYFFLQENGLAKITDNTVEWLADQLVRVPSGYYVAVFMHYAYISGSTDTDSLQGRINASVKRISTMLGAYDRKETVSIDGDTYDFTSANGNVICIFSGHVHHDDALLKSVSDDHILTIATTGDLYRDGSGNEYSYVIDGVTYYRTPGTVREQAFDVIHIDITNRKVYMKRLGGGADREFIF